MDTEKKNYIIYSRKSKFTGKGESIANQIEMCREHIALHDSRTAADHARIYEDEGYSGGNLDRPQFKRMMEDLKYIQNAVIVVYRLDRISRNIADFSRLIEDLSSRNIGFLSISESFDTGTPLGRAMMYIASVFSQLERETIAERIRDNLYELSKTGRWLGGNTPTGYRSEAEVQVTIDGKTHKAFKLTPIPEQLAIVKLLFDKFYETGSLTATEQFLMEHKYKTKTGLDFTRFAIKAILENPVYCIADQAIYEYMTEKNADVFAEKEAFNSKHGVISYNRSIQKTGKPHKIRPVEEWVIAIGKHKGIIPGERWVKIQEMLEANRSKSYHRPRSNVALLSGLLICADCGNYLRPKLTQRTNKEGELIYTYLCNTKERSRRTRCNLPNISGNTLDAKIIEELKKLPEDQERFSELCLKSKKAMQSEDTNANELSALKKQIAETEANIKALVMSLTSAEDGIAKKYILEQIDILHHSLESSKSRLESLSRLSTQQFLTEEAFSFQTARLSSFSAAIDHATVEEKRRLIRSLVKKVVWDGKTATVFLFTESGEVDPSVFDITMMPICVDSE